LTIVVLAALGVASLVALPLFARGAAERTDFARPEALPEEPQLPEKREEPVVPVEELHEALRLPRVDTTLTDKHSKNALAAYETADYERAFKEAVLSLDPTPLGKNELYRVLANPDVGDPFALRTVEKGNGRQALEAVDEVLQPILRTQDTQEAAARLNNASTLMTLRDYNRGPSADPSDQNRHPGEGLLVSQELALQAADLRPSYCPALLNLTVYSSVGKGEGRLTFAPDYDTDDDLNPAGSPLGVLPFHPSDWKDYYQVEGCRDPALLYYMAQDLKSLSLHLLTEEDKEAARATTFRLIDRLQAVPGWEGLAHSVRGDTYYWFGLYSFERTDKKQLFTAQRYFKLALTEYDAALRLQPDDTAIHHGKALAYLELPGEGEEAIREAETALEAAPHSPRLQLTTVGAYEENGLYAAAAQLNRNFLSTQRPTSPPLTLVPYSAISHGADRYSELSVPLPGTGSGPAVLRDDEVIEKSRPLGYFSRVANWSVPAGWNQQRGELRDYLLLRDIVLSGNYGALDDRLREAPEAVREHDRTLLLAGIDSLLNQPQDKVTPTEKTQTLIDNFLVADEPYAQSWSAYHFAGLRLQANDLFYLEAGNFFRQYKRYDVAIRVYRIWQTELRQAGAGDYRKAEVERLLGEAYFLKGKVRFSDQENPPNEYREALVAFEQAAKRRGDWPPYVVRKAFMYEKLGDYDAAEGFYCDALNMMRQRAESPECYEGPFDFSHPDKYQAIKHLGDVLMVQAEYDKAARVYLEAQGRELGDQYYVPNSAATSNLGIALLMEKNYEAGIEVLESLVRPGASFVSSGKTIVPDEHNPIFRLNLGWAYERHGEPKKAKSQYLEAVKSDPTFFPALNDLGVLAAKEGRLEEAKGYFYAALDAKRDYAHASYNLGVALISSGGMGNFLAAQSYLARAVNHDPALRDATYDYIFDNKLYLLDLSLAEKLPADWEFAARAEQSAFYVSSAAAVLLMWRIIRRTGLDTIRETLAGRLFEWVQTRFGVPAARFWAYIRDLWLRSARLGRIGRDRWWVTPLALLVSAPVVALAQSWSLLQQDSAAKLVMIVTLLYVALVSLLVHHAGHAMVGLRSGLRVQEAPWVAGIIQALALANFGGPFVAPMPATSVEGDAEERRRQLVYLAGPVTSILFAVLLYVLYLSSNVPLFHFGAVLNLGLAAASLLSLPPLEGATIAVGYYTRWTFWATIFVTVMSALLAISHFS
jgi:Tfp pilus assembly protein PilF/Zn-dependent protease